MIDRINKAGDSNYWRVKATSESKEDKKRDDERGRGQGQRDSFGETSDFIQLISKDPKKYRRQEIDTSQISSFTFRGVSTHREKAILEVDITLADGTLLKGAQVALSRQEGMKFLSRKVGEPIVASQLVKGTAMTVAIPQIESVASQKTTSPAPRAQEKARTETKLAWYYYVGFLILFGAMGALLYIFITL